ncbi:MULTISPECIES: CHAT domain-containing protein [Streptomyces]|uniref:CHAT domain-containing protein n=1 Tax=Streptomyces TaxID=1883 RepID=UPI00186ADA36|nr:MULTISPECIES: CHAT domain-containing protein [Streptomyces]
MWLLPVALMMSGRSCLPLVALLVVMALQTWGTWWLLVPLTLFSVIARTHYLGYRIVSSKMRLSHEDARRRITSLYGAGRPRRASTLRRAITLLRGGLEAAPPGDPERLWYLNTFGKVVHVMVAQHLDPAAADGVTDLLREAVRHGREARATTPTTDPDRSDILGTLQLSLFLLFLADRHSAERSARVAELDTALLDEAVSIGWEAVAAAPPTDPERASHMTNLGGALLFSFLLHRDPQLLEKAIQVARDSVAATLPDDPDPSGYLTTLSTYLQIKFMMVGDLGVLEEAVVVGRSAVAAAAPSPLSRSANLNNLAAALYLLCTRRRDPQLLEETTRISRTALAQVPREHPNRTLILLNLSQVLRLTVERGGSPALLDEAFRFGRKAIDATWLDHPYRISSLLSFGQVLRDLSVRDGSPAKMSEAVMYCREALSIASSDDAFENMRNRCRFVLGDVLSSRFDMAGDPGDVLEARHLLATVAIAAESNDYRLPAAVKAAELDLLADDCEHAMVMVELAVELLPQLTSRRIGSADRRHLVAGFTGLAATAAVSAIAAGAPERAVELLEQTRGVVLSDAFDTRGDLTLLDEGAPDLVGAFDDLRQEIERADHASASPDFSAALMGTGVPAKSNHQQLTERRARLERQWVRLLGRIRERPGLEDFLLPPPVERLREQAVEGPVVYVVPHRRGGHALIVTDAPERPVRVVSLPAFTQDAASEQVALLRAALDDASDADLPAPERQAAQQRILEVLSLLWDTVAEPVLRHLGHTAPPPQGSPWPRIWWCPVGISAFLPLHAAGHHADGAPSSAVMDRVISSYTPTIRALGHARAPRSYASGQRPAMVDNPSMLVVAVPDAPGSPPLPGVVSEVDLLLRKFPTATVLPAPGTPATHDEITAALVNGHIAHFACHGLADPADPADSRLLLHDHLEHPLTIVDIARLRLPHGELAFLSACSTTDTDLRHADEATHLSAAFQLAGYRSVIGTLWPVNDHAAAGIADAFYTQLSHGGTAPAAASAFLALHHAVRTHRARHPTMPTQWAAYVHSGR